MTPFEIIKEQRRLNALKGLAARPRRKRIVHLDDVRSIGVVAHDLSATDKDVLEQFTSVMTNRGSILRKIELPAIDETLVDKLGFPKTDFTQLFTTYHYDILIDITPPNDLFGLYVTLITSSYLRIGYIDTSQPINKLSLAAYDLIIRGQGPCTLTDYLKQVLTILTQIRK